MVSIDLISLGCAWLLPFGKVRMGFREGLDGLYDSKKCQAEGPLSEMGIN